MVRTAAQILHLTEELEATYACRNLMGRFVYYNATYRNRDILPMWSAREDSFVEMPWGSYSGKKAIADFLEEQGDRRDPAVFENLKGVMRLYELQSELIELSEDGKTAYGIWASPGEDTHLECWAPIGEWRWCRYGVHFVLEDGQWKIWKLRMLPLFRTNYYRTWVTEDQPEPEDYGYGKAAAKTQQDWQYDVGTVFPENYPAVPEKAPQPELADVCVDMDDIRRRLERMQAVQDCRNLMGAYSLLHTAYRNKEYVKLWANREDDVLLMPWGAYYGIDGVTHCYLVDHGDRDDLAAEDNPQLHGGMFMHCMDTEVLEISEDGQTARGVWLDPGHETYVEFLEDDGKLARDDWDQGIAHADWCWGRYLVNFIKEDGVWKFWQMQLYPCTRQSVYTCWTHNKPYPGHKFAMGDPLPEENWEYSDEAIYPAYRPDPPVPYKTFDMSIHGIMAQFDKKEDA